MTAPYTPASDRYNVLAVIGFIASFFVAIVGIVLGFIALSQIKRTGEKGRGLAIAAVVIGFVVSVLVVLLFSLGASIISTVFFNELNDVPNGSY